MTSGIHLLPGGKSLPVCLLCYTSLELAGLSGLLVLHLNVDHPLYSTGLLCNMAGMLPLPPHTPVIDHCP